MGQPMGQPGLGADSTAPADCEGQPRRAEGQKEKVAGRARGRVMSCKHDTPVLVAAQRSPVTLTPLRP